MFKIPMDLVVKDLQLAELVALKLQVAQELELRNYRSDHSTDSGACVQMPQTGGAGSKYEPVGPYGRMHFREPYSNHTDVRYLLGKDARFCAIAMRCSSSVDRAWFIDPVLAEAHAIKLMDKPHQKASALAVVAVAKVVTRTSPPVVARDAQPEDFID